MNDRLRLDRPGDLYATTAAAAVPSRPLAGDRRVEVAIVGGGYTGLSTALHLAERGKEVALVEAGELGWGAAGRNGGQVNAGLKHEPDEVERALGPVHGPRLVQLSGGAPDYLFSLIERYRIDCEAQRGGTLRAAYRHGGRRALETHVRQWRERGVEIELLDAAGVAAATGTTRYVAATRDPRGGALNPLSFARGLAAAALARGAVLHGDTRATRLERDGGGWRVITAGGALRANTLVLATDGYSDHLWPRLAQSFIPVYSSIVATEPLPEAIAHTILPAGEVLYESGNVTVYYRRDRANRLLMGGRGRQHEPSGPQDFRHLIRYAEELWPAIAGQRWTHGWNGQFALTPDFYPRLHAPAPNVLVALGYSGRGVALATTMGAELAAAATGTPLAELALPVMPIKPIPFHRFWRIGVAARIAFGRLQDSLGS
ncbi:MAG: FAD-binding oxidoreductase [Proteobacteria bacterium]|nr:FAD-binding oxidoreductase [Pseudomonadota bacterium]